MEHLSDNRSRSRARRLDYGQAVLGVEPPADRSSFIWGGWEYDGFRAIRSRLGAELGRRKHDHLAIACRRKRRAEVE